MLPKKGSGGDHVTDPIIALVVLMVSHSPWRQVLFPRVPHVLRRWSLCQAQRRRTTQIQLHLSRTLSEWHHRASMSRNAWNYTRYSLVQSLSLSYRRSDPEEYPALFPSFLPSTQAAYGSPE